MVPGWLSVLAWCWLVVAAGCAAWLVVEIYVRGYRQPMRVMELVWPITALYAGPLSLLAYRSIGRPATSRWQDEHGRKEPPELSWHLNVSAAVTHCGAGCTLGDIVAEVGVFLIGLTVATSTLAAEYVGDYIFAIMFGLAFQYYAIAPQRDLDVHSAIVAAAKADFLSLTAFEIGLFGWMALTALVLFTTPHLTPGSPVYWFMMQIGMCWGFLTAYPVNSWLIRHGIKEKM